MADEGIDKRRLGSLDKYAEVKEFTFSGFTLGVDRSKRSLRGFLPRKTTPRDLGQAPSVVKPL
jgi:hypothetical protein